MRGFTVTMLLLVITMYIILLPMVYITCMLILSFIMCYHYFVFLLVFGVAIGALLVFIFKWNGRQNILFASVITICSIPFLLAYIFYCPTVSLAGVTTAYADGYI